METKHTWRKALSSQNNANCIELRNSLDQLRDSKNASGPVLRGDIRTLLFAIQTGTFDR